MANGLDVGKTLTQRLSATRGRISVSEKRFDPQETTSYFSERDGYRVSLREGSEHHPFTTVRSLSHNFPALAQHLGHVIVHLLELQQAALVRHS